VLAIGEVQHPETRRHFGARGTIEPPSSQLGFSIGALITESSVVLKYVDYGGANAKRLGELKRLNKVEIVG